jgi:hypothetical protein
VGEEASLSDLAFEGARTLTPGLGTLTVRVERIVNRAAQGVSGTLAVRLRVQPESCRGGPSDGRIVGGSKLQAIPAGAALRDFSVIIPTENVPSGYYVPALTLEEQHPGASNRWGVVQTVPIGERMFIGRRVTLRGISLKREADLDRRAPEPDRGDHRHDQPGRVCHGRAVCRRLNQGTAARGSPGGEPRSQ